MSNVIDMQEAKKARRTRRYIKRTVITTGVILVAWCAMGFIMAEADKDLRPEMYPNS